jgi:protease-4
MMELVERLGKDDNVKGVLVSIDSPGGTSVGGERLYKALRELNETKPVVTHINTLGASAAYMTAVASDHIVAYRTSLTGSVGVLIQYGQINELLDNLGIAVSKVDSGPLKAEPSPFEPAAPEAVEALQSVVDNTFEWFIDLVTERRQLTEAQVERVATGRIFTGEQALEEGLVDAIGGEADAIAWLESERGVPQDLPVRTYEPSDASDLSVTARITDRVMDRVLGATGISLPPIAPGGSVDGLWSVWHAPEQSDAGVANDD